MSLFGNIKGGFSWHQTPASRVKAEGRAQEFLLTGAAQRIGAGYEQAISRYGYGKGEGPGEALGRLREDPGYLAERGAYQFRMGQGTRAIEGGAAARGGLFSGRTLQELMTFGQELASTEYEKEYGRLAGEAQAIGQLDIGRGEAAAMPYIGMSQWMAGHAEKGREIAGSWGQAGTWMGGGSR